MIIKPTGCLMGILCVLGSMAQTTQDISSGAARNIFDLLRTIPGVEISMNSGSLKTQQQVYIRDARNMKGKVPAIFVVDKAIYDGDISLINPMDVASMTALKDEAAKAIYGARGFGGVIVITTKNGTGTIPVAVSTYEKSAYQYFINRGIELKVVGKDGKTIANGVITKETDSSVLMRKKEILKKNIEKVEIITQ
jgi:TonB-dependent SusC/RagA subfamily outer membrane receptor